VFEVTSNVTLIKPLGVLIGVLWILYKMRVEGEFELDMPIILVIVFLAYNMLSIAWTINSSDTLVRTVNLASNVALVLFIMDIVDSRRWLDTIFTVFSVSVSVAVSLELVLYVFEDLPRLGELFAGPNETAAMLVYSIVITWYLIRSSRTMTNRTDLLAMLLGIQTLTLFLTASRQGMLSIFTVAVFGVVIEAKKTDAPYRIGATMGFVSIILMSFLVILNVDVINRLEPIYEILIEGKRIPQDSSIGARVRLYENGLEIFRQAPALGVGSGTFKTGYAALIGYEKAADSMLLQLLVTTGLIGTSIFASFLMLLWRGALKRRDSDSFLIVGLLICYSILTLFNDFITGLTPWLILAFVVATRQTDG